MNFEYFRKSVEVVKQANKSVTYLETSYHNTIKSSRRPTILKKTICLIFGLLSPKLAQNWPKNKFKYKILISIPKGVVNQANTSVNCVETFYYNANKKQ